MRIKCDFCDATAIGSQEGLMMAGWVRAVFSSPKRITISACPAHQREWSDRVEAIFTSVKEREV